MSEKGQPKILNLHFRKQGATGETLGNKIVRMQLTNCPVKTTDSLLHGKYGVNHYEKDDPLQRGPPLGGSK